MSGLDSYFSFISSVYDDSTVRWHRVFLRDFERFSSLCGKGMGFDSLVMWVDELKRRGLSDGSVRQAISAVMGYFSFAGVDVDKARLKLLKRAVKPIEVRVDVLSEEEVKRVIMAASPFKYKVLFSLMYVYARRASEVLELCWSDVDFDSMTIRFNILKKRSREHAVFHMDELTATMLARLKRLGKSRGNRVFDVSYEGVRRAFKTAVKRAGIKEYGRKITPHILRKSRITHLLKMGYPVDVVSKYIARHSNFNTTVQFYRSVTREEIEDIPMLKWLIEEV
ncbi:MAG: site-specific integrase [Thermofilum sp.]|uniref:tyrosine-type recombinase/integrase n=1 Tax=Thermofilum sp. TaxID=1961369 RepID=UPI00317D5AE7